MDKMFVCFNEDNEIDKNGVYNMPINMALVQNFRLQSFPGIINKEKYFLIKFYFKMNDGETDADGRHYEASELWWFKSEEKRKEVYNALKVKFCISL